MFIICVYFLLSCRKEREKEIVMVVITGSIILHVKESVQFLYQWTC